MKFEYKHLVVTGEVGFNELSSLGLEGWDLITIIPQNRKFLYVLKRQI